MTRRSLVLAISVAALIPAACATPAQEPVALTPEQWRAAQVAFLASNAKQRGWAATPSGLRCRRLKAAHGAAAKPEPGATVTLHYIGRLTDGRVFDSSRERGEPATFPLGRLIKGWQEGVPMMAVGEIWAFVIPPELAYGDRTDRDPIPPGSVLQFEIELLAIAAPVEKSITGE